METELRHSGIKGQKHGVRRFQYPDGRWTEAGKIRYGSRAEKREARKQAKEIERTQKEVKAAEERRKKILENPAELRKHLDEFSKEEIADAMQKFDTSRKLADISKADLQKIAETKMPDLTAASLETAMKTIAGTARSMGIEVEE